MKVSAKCEVVSAKSVVSAKPAVRSAKSVAYTVVSAKSAVRSLREDKFTQAKTEVLKIDMPFWELSLLLRRSYET